MQFGGPTQVSYLQATTKATPPIKQKDSKRKKRDKWVLLE